MASVPERCRLSSRLAHVIVTVELLVASVPCQAQPDTTVQVVSATSLRGKIMCGYQGWFRCPGDACRHGMDSLESRREADFAPDADLLKCGRTCGVLPLASDSPHRVSHSPTVDRRSYSVPITRRQCCGISSGCGITALMGHGSSTSSWTCPAVPAAKPLYVATPCARYVRAAAPEDRPRLGAVRSTSRGCRSIGSTMF